MKKMSTIIALLMPLIIAMVWLIYVIVSSKTFTLAGGARLAPIRDTTPLIIGLCVFIGGYMLFMFMMFSEDIKEMFSKKKPEKKKRK
ncbi:hypothetical protein KY360_03425 [Candidatus Woesearchaeota archaeon]|nr:hypothetical protein [Candidatus Woesearchaeota archaeon]